MISLFFFSILIFFSASSDFYLANLSISRNAWIGSVVSTDKEQVQPLTMTAEEGNIGRFRIFSPKKERWEIPENYYSYNRDEENKGKKFQQSKEYMHFEFPKNCKNDFSMENSPILKVVGRRESDRIKVFELSSLKNYKDQFIEFTLHLDYIGEKDEDYIYGLGEHSASKLRLENNKTYTIFNKNHHFVYEGLNLYGSHPFLLQILPDGKANGFFFLNSNGMDVTVINHELKFKVIGGIIDFFIFTGSSPQKVLYQYFSIIGKPKMIPSFALGYHQSKYGYKTLGEMYKVVEKHKEAKIPMDAIWSDIDYMENYQTFTVGNQFEEHGTFKIKDFVDHLHTNNQSWIPILDPGIKIAPNQNYSPYDNGMELDIFIKKSETEPNTPFLGRMFCGDAYFPDFEHPNAQKYWNEEVAKFYESTGFDAVWNDQNELTSFCDGFCVDFSKEINNKYDKPPYSPGNNSLYSLTISMTAKQYHSIHYNTHNLYPLEETKATIIAIEKARKKRSFIVSRSSFPGLGKYSGHWLGDNNATWTDLQQSVIGIQSFNLFGVPLVGADVGGFYSQCPENLMIRWLQLGVFYPFMRNHARKDVEFQELYKFSPKVQQVAKETIGLRYSLNQLLYTSFYLFHKNGYPLVITPLFIEFPYDTKTFDISNQYLIGNSILFAPVLQDGDNLVQNVYFPPGNIWFYQNGLRVVYQSQIVPINVQLDQMLFFYRGGHIVIKQTPQKTLKETRNSSPFQLIIPMDQNNKAKGTLYLDDGETVNYKTENYIVDFEIEKKIEHLYNLNCVSFIRLKSIVIKNTGKKKKNDLEYFKNGNFYINKITIMGIHGDIVKIINLSPSSSSSSNSSSIPSSSSSSHSSSTSVSIDDYFIHTETQVLTVQLNNKDLNILENLDIVFCSSTFLDLFFQIIFYIIIVLFFFVVLLFILYFFIILLIKQKKKNYSNIGDHDEENPQPHESLENGYGHIQHNNSTQGKIGHPKKKKDLHYFTHLRSDSEEEDEEKHLLNAFEKVVENTKVQH